MTKILILLTLLGLFNFSASCQNSKNRMYFGEQYARAELKQSITDSTLHNVINKRVELIKSKETAIEVAETILFKMYGRKNIMDQRPYEIYKIDNYWSISGTLPRGMVGGTFLIIIDSRDSRIVRITHGK